MIHFNIAELWGFRGRLLDREPVERASLDDRVREDSSVLRNLRLEGLGASSSSTPSPLPSLGTRRGRRVPERTLTWLVLPSKLRDEASPPTRTF